MNIIVGGKVYTPSEWARYQKLLAQQRRNKQRSRSKPENRETERAYQKAYQAAHREQRRDYNREYMRWYRAEQKRGFLHDVGCLNAPCRCAVVIRVAE